MTQTKLNKGKKPNVNFYAKGKKVSFYSKKPKRKIIGGYEYTRYTEGARNGRTKIFGNLRIAMLDREAEGYHVVPLPEGDKFVLWQRKRRK